MKLEKIEQISSQVLTFFWEDGHQSIYFVEHLRANCPCAPCKEQREDTNPLKVLNTNSEQFEIKGWSLIGRYAVGLKWEDGHDTGIYTYEFLRSLCQCDVCTKG
jgi:DUF971 family protein